MTAVVEIAILTCRTCGGTWRERTEEGPDAGGYRIMARLDEWPHNQDSTPAEDGACPYCAGYPLTFWWREGRPTRPTAPRLATPPLLYDAVVGAWTQAFTEWDRQAQATIALGIDWGDGEPHAVVEEAP